MAALRARCETHLLLQHRRLLQLLNPLLPELRTPIRQQQPRQNRITPNLTPLCFRHTLDQMQLRSLRNRVRHARARNTAAGNGARDQHNTAFCVRIESRQGSGNELLDSQYVGTPAAIPLVVGHGFEIVEVGEARPACIGDQDVKATQVVNGRLYQRFDIGAGACVGFEDCCFDSVGGLEFLREFLRRFRRVGVVDGYISPFCCELAGDFGAEASVC